MKCTNVYKLQFYLSVIDPRHEMRALYIHLIELNNVTNWTEYPLNFSCFLLDEDTYRDMEESNTQTVKIHKNKFIAELNTDTHLHWTIVVKLQYDVDIMHIKHLNIYCNITNTQIILLSLSNIMTSCEKKMRPWKKMCPRKCYFGIYFPNCEGTLEIYIKLTLCLAHGYFTTLVHTLISKYMYFII